MCKCDERSNFSSSLWGVVWSNWRNQCCGCLFELLSNSLHCNASYHQAPKYLNILNIFGNNISLYTNLKIYLFFINLFICLFELLSNSLIYKIMKPKKWKIKFLKKFVCFKGFLPQISALLKVKLCISHILNTFPSEKAEQIALLCLLHKYQKYKSVESVGRSTNIRNTNQLSWAINWEKGARKVMRRIEVLGRCSTFSVSILYICICI